MKSLLDEIALKKKLVQDLKKQKGQYLTHLEIVLKENEWQNDKVVQVPKRKLEEDEEVRDEEDQKRQRILQEINRKKSELKEQELENVETGVSDKAATTTPIQLTDLKLEETISDHNINLQDIKDNPTKVLAQLRAYIKYLLQEWDSSVLPTDDKQQELLIETKRNIAPLLVKLRQGKLEDDALNGLLNTLKHLQDHNYLQSNDSYLNLSIDNSLWPIGALNVGIHSRSNHTRLAGAQNKTNIMSDQKTRLWLLSVKRLITFAERKWPN